MRTRIFMSNQRPNSVCAKCNKSNAPGTPPRLGLPIVFLPESRTAWCVECWNTTNPTDKWTAEREKSPEVRFVVVLDRDTSKSVADRLKFEGVKSHKEFQFSVEELIKVSTLMMDLAAVRANSIVEGRKVLSKLTEEEKKQLMLVLNEEKLEEKERRLGVSTNVNTNVSVAEGQPSL